MTGYIRPRCIQGPDQGGKVSFVLVHGGGFAGSCWDRLLPLLDGDAIAVDLPGRGSRPADLSTVTLDDWAAAVLEEMDARDLTDVVLVGHSMAGLTLPRVLHSGAGRIRHAVFVSCAVPPDGARLLDVVHLLTPDIGDVAALVERDDQPGGGLSPAILEAMFCNDMDADLTRFTLERVVPETTHGLAEPVDLSGLRSGVPLLYVRLLQDAAIPLASQDQMMANLGGAEMADIDCGHMVMISQPEKLAALLNGL